MTEEYRVQLDIFSGPLDLLLFLIRRDELDVEDIPIARVTEQYMDYVRLLEALDPDRAGEFLVLASTLVELKSRALLPTPPIEPLDDDEDDPRAQLVRELLEYKRFKDAAAALGHAADERAQRFVRKPVDLPKELQGVELEEAQVWDLLRAFKRVMEAVGKAPLTHDVRVDDTPLQEYAERIAEALERAPQRFTALLGAARDRAEIVGLFLALLELIRNRRVCAEQASAGEDIYLFALEPVDIEGGPAPEGQATPEAAADAQEPTAAASDAQALAESDDDENV